jgi:hypothetical protein
MAHGYSQHPIVSGEGGRGARLGLDFALGERASNASCDKGTEGERNTVTDGVFWCFFFTGARTTSFTFPAAVPLLIAFGGGGTGDLLLAAAFRCTTDGGGSSKSSSLSEEMLPVSRL